MRDSDFLKRFGHIRKLLHRGLPPKSKVSATAFSNLGSTMLGLIQLVAQPDDLSDIDIWMSMSIIQLVAATPYRRLQIALTTAESLNVRFWSGFSRIVFLMGIIEPQKKSLPSSYPLKTYFAKKMVQNGHLWPQQWSDHSTPAYMGSQPPTR